jgi:hypothetical protein
MFVEARRPAHRSIFAKIPKFFRMNNMAQRGRHGSKIPNYPFATKASTRLTAPSTLTKAERDLFNSIVATCHPQHFVECDRELLVSYIELVVRLRSSKKPVEEKSELLRLQISFATRLRLTPQSRMDKHGFARMATNYEPSPLDRFMAERNEDAETN